MNSSNQNDKITHSVAFYVSICCLLTEFAYICVCVCRCEELEKEVAILKEKIHHLDDMLKSQQRKVRHMIEQLQNSRTVIQERERFIRDLEERVAFLEAENREMHDHMEYFLAGQEPPPLTSTENKPEVVYSKTLTPSSPTNKALPFIKVIEIMS